MLRKSIFRSSFFKINFFLNVPMVKISCLFSFLSFTFPNAFVYFTKKQQQHHRISHPLWIYKLHCIKIQFSSVQSLSRVWLFATPWTAACQASLSTTNSWSLLKLKSIKSVIQPSHPLSSPSPPAINLSQHQGLFQWISSSHQVAKVLYKIYKVLHKDYEVPNNSSKFWHLEASFNQDTVWVSVIFLKNDFKKDVVKYNIYNTCLFVFFYFLWPSQVLVKKKKW